MSLNSISFCIVGQILFIVVLLLSSCAAHPERTILAKLHLQHEACERSGDMPENFRMDNYRAPTPHCVPNGLTIDTQQLQQLIELKPELVLIDVLSILTRPNTEFGETRWLPGKPRYSLPGSVWLPNVGYGSLDQEMQLYFKTRLNELTRGDKGRPLVFFCIADCWMSWNALKRAYEYGYTNLYWYKNGTDGWEENGLSTQKIEPVMMMEKIE